MSEATPPQLSSENLKIVWWIVSTYGVGFIGLIWHIAMWKARVDYDLDNFGKLLGTEKGLARAKAKEETPPDKVSKEP